MILLTPFGDTGIEAWQSVAIEVNRPSIIDPVHHAKITAREHVAAGRSAIKLPLTPPPMSNSSPTTPGKFDNPSTNLNSYPVLLSTNTRRARREALPNTRTRHDSTPRHAGEVARAVLRDSYVNLIMRVGSFSVSCWSIWADLKDQETGKVVDTTASGSSQHKATDKSQQISSGSSTKRSSLPQFPVGNGYRDDDDNGDRSPERLPKKRRLDPDPPPQNLACPFFKFAPAKHYQCGRLSLSKISYVKQHLLRRHVHIYCMRCYEEFDRPEDLEQHHRRTQPCEMASDGERPPGISLSQRELLGQRSLHGRDEVEKWHDVWRILFPDQNPPQSVYVDLELPEGVTWFTDNMATQVSQNLKDRIEKDQPELVDHSEALAKNLIDFIIQITSDWKQQWIAGLQERGGACASKPVPVRDSDSSL